MHLISQTLSTLPQIAHAFGTLGEEWPAIEETQDRLPPVTKQVHGIKAAKVLEQGQDCGECDALWTQKENVVLAVRTADCLPILMAHQSGHAIAAIHAGWRGLLARIIPATFQQMEEQGLAPEYRDHHKWIAVIGPSIGPCCFEVGLDVHADFRRVFGSHAPQSAFSRPRHLDLQSLAEAELRACGLSVIERAKRHSCTFCSGLPDRPLFHSHRRHGAKAGRNQSVILIKASLHPT